MSHRGPGEPASKSKQLEPRLGIISFPIRLLLSFQSKEQIWGATWRRWKKNHSHHFLLSAPFFSSCLLERHDLWRVTFGYYISANTWSRSMLMELMFVLPSMINLAIWAYFPRQYRFSGPSLNTHFKFYLFRLLLKDIFRHGWTYIHMCPCIWDRVITDWDVQVSSIFFKNLAAVNNCFV